MKLYTFEVNEELNFARYTVERHILSYYKDKNVDPTVIPPKATVARFKDANDCGLFLGVVRQWWDISLIKRIGEVYSNVNQVDKKKIRELRREVVQQTIEVFHCDYNSRPSSSAATPVNEPADLPDFEDNVQATSGELQQNTDTNASATDDGMPKKVVNAAIDKLQDRVTQSKSSASSRHKFACGLKERDGQCLFCFSKLNVQAAHLIGQKQSIIRPNIDQMMRKANLRTLNDVANGLLLCSICHNGFDRLKAYVDVYVSDDGLEWNYFLNFTEDEERLDRYIQTAGLRKIRIDVQQFNRVVQQDEGFPLYFAKSDNLPSPFAVLCHKVCCNTWKLAGGAGFHEVDVADSGTPSEGDFPLVDQYDSTFDYNIMDKYFSSIDEAKLIQEPINENINIENLH